MADRLIHGTSQIRDLVSLSNQTRRRYASWEHTEIVVRVVGTTMSEAGMFGSMY